MPPARDAAPPPSQRRRALRARRGSDAARSRTRLESARRPRRARAHGAATDAPGDSRARRLDLVLRPGLAPRRRDGRGRGAAPRAPLRRLRGRPLREPPVRSAGGSAHSRHRRRRRPAAPGRAAVDGGREREGCPRTDDGARVAPPRRACRRRSHDGRPRAAPPWARPAARSTTRLADAAPSGARVCSPLALRRGGARCARARGLHLARNPTRSRRSCMTAAEFLERLEGERYLALDVELEPVGSPTIQPTTFANTGPSFYEAPDGQLAAVVDSVASMANQLELTIWDEAACEPTRPVAPLPWVKVVDADGAYYTSSRRAAHRLGAHSLLNGAEAGTGEVMEARLKRRLDGARAPMFTQLAQVVWE